jgi:putative ABC transport system substrate-binding protein
MRRRDFISLVGGAAVWPQAARAQQARKLPTIGFLGLTTPSAWSPWVAAFSQRLRELGWVEGRSVAIEYRWSEGHDDRLPALAAEFERLKVDIVVTGGPAAVNAVKQAMPAAPVVFALTADPIGTGLVSSLARPGGNATGLSMLLPDTAGKRLELLREIVPDLRRLAIMANSGFPDSMLDFGQIELMAKTLGLEAVPLKIRQTGDITPAFEQLTGTAQAIYICADPLVFTNRIRINTLAQGARLPTNVWSSGVCRSGWAGFLWTEYTGLVPPGRRLCR